MAGSNNFVAIGTGRHQQSFVKVKECTPELLRVIPTNWLANKGRVPGESEGSDDDENDVESSGLLSSSYAGEEATIPFDCVEPLRQSRGKSGGMYHPVSCCLALTVSRT